jgi:hypothetical protein
MANKVVKIEADIAPKPSTAMQRELKKLGTEVQKTFGPKAMEATTKALDKHIKGLQQTIKLTKEQGKIYKDHVLAPLQEHERVYKRIVTQVERSQRILNGGDRSVRWLARKLRSEGVTHAGDPDAYAIYDQQSKVRNARTQSMAQGNFMAGMDIIEQRRKADADASQEERMKKVATAMAIGAATRVAGQTLATGGDIIYGQSMRKAQFGSEAAGFAGKMYNDLTRGDYTGMIAAMGDPAARAKFKEIVADSEMRSKTNQAGAAVGAVGGIIGGSAQTALGFGMMSVPGGAGMGGMNAMGGIGTVAGSIGELGGVGANYMAGKTEADVSSSAIQGMEYVRTLNPIRLRHLQELQGRTRQIAEFGSLSSLGGDPALKMNEMGRVGVLGGIGSLDETMSQFQALRGVMTHTSAMDKDNLAMVTRAPELLGIGREAAVQGMGATSRMAGGTAGASGELFNIMRKATALGLDDAKIREAIISELPRIMESGMGREKTLGNVMDVMSLAKTSAADHGGPVDLRDLSTAAAAVKIGGKWTGGGTGIGSIDVPMVGGGIVLGSKIRKEHKSFNAMTAQRFATLGIDQLNLGNAYVQDAFQQANINDPKVQEEILGKYREQKGQTADQAIKASGLGKANYISNFAEAMGITYDEAKLALYGVSRGENVRQKDRTAADPNGPSNAHMLDPRARSANEANVANAGNEYAPTNAAMTDEENKGQLKNAITAAGTFINQLERLSKVNVDGLKNVPGLVTDLAIAVERLGVATQGVNLPGTAGGR